MFAKGTRGHHGECLLRVMALCYWVTKKTSHSENPKIDMCTHYDEGRGVLNTVVKFNSPGGYTVPPTTKSYSHRKENVIREEAFSFGNDSFH